ncbi:glycosyltransferase family 39 protein [Candidatus Micrarchaeota archaeon]|nr:glycosyltransferase family 39 protein [Candidatus Micrarchaeota archaeon]
MNQNSLIILAIFIACVFSVYSLHINYPLPYHSEEFDHEIMAKETAKTGKITAGTNWEIGFSVFFGIINSLLFNNLIDFLVFIPILFALMISFSSFLLGRHLFKNNLAGMLFALFALMIPSNPGIMGLMFAVPNSMALALTPMLLFLFLKGTTHKKSALLFIILFAFTTIVHPAFTLILIPIIGFYLLINPKLFERNQFKIAVGIIALILLLPFFASRIGLEQVNLTHNTLTSISKNLSKVLVWESITQSNPKFYLTDFLGHYILFLAGIGFGLMLMLRLLIEVKRRKGKTSEMEKDFIVSKHQIILPIALIILGFLYMHFNLKNYTFIVPYERMYLELMLFFLLNAASGVFLLWKILSKKTSQEMLKPLSIGFIVLILFLLLTVPFSQQKELYKNIEVTGIPAVSWIQENTKKDSSFIALPKHSLAIKAFTERKIFASPSTRAGIPDDYGMESFFMKNCPEKKETIEKTKAEYIFSEKEISCDSFEKIYDKKEYKIYLVS